MISTGTDDAQEPPTAGSELQDTYTRALAALRSLLDQAENGSIGPISAEDRDAILNGVEVRVTSVRFTGGCNTHVDCAYIIDSNCSKPMPTHL